MARRRKNKGFFAKIPKYAWLIIIAAVLLVPLPSLKPTQESGSMVALGFGPSIVGRIVGLFTNREAEPEGGLRMDIYEVSGCPYCEKFILETLPQILDAYPTIDWNVWYVTSKSGDDYASMHGQAEYDENLREICIWNEYGKYTWLDFVTCNYESGNFAECAAENGIDANKIENCKNSQEAEIIEPHYQKSLEFSVTGTPTIVFNNGEETVVGAQPFEKFNQTIQKILTGEVTAEPEVVNLVISPKDCPEEICAPGWVAETLREQFGANITLNVIDPDDTDIDEILGVSAYPVFLFDSAITESAAYDSIGDYLTPAGDLYVLATRPSVLNRPVEEDRLDLFVMSQCPYGNAAMEAMEEVVTAMPGLDVNVWYIANENGDGFDSLHGQTEVDEDIRQVCILDEAPGKFWNYMSCMVPVYSNAGTEWENCATEAGINKAQLSTCWQGEEGKQLLRDNIAFANELGFGSSPTFLINGRYILSGMPQTGAEGIKGFVCVLNPELSGCEQTLTQQSTASGAC
jgi:protein-disulfide isomerase